MSFAFEVHGKDEFFQANQILVPHFRLFGIKKNRKKEETPRLSCKKRDSKHGNNSEKKKCFFEKKGEYVKRRKEKRQRKVNQTQENLQKRDTFKKNT